MVGTRCLRMVCWSFHESLLMCQAFFFKTRTTWDTYAVIISAKHVKFPAVISTYILHQSSINIISDKYAVVLQLLGTSCWYRDNCIPKLWAQGSYFLYLYMVFFRHFFHLEQHCFHLDRHFSCSSNTSNLLSRVLNSI